jgi:Galactose oxidase, central domain
MLHAQFVMSVSRVRWFSNSICVAPALMKRTLFVMFTLRSWSSLAVVALSAYWLFAGAACSTAVVPSEPATSIAQTRDPLSAAREIGRSDARIAQLLRPLANASGPANSAHAYVGFDAARTSYGAQTGDPSAIALTLASHAAGTFYAGAGAGPRFQIAFTPGAAARSYAHAELIDGAMTYRDAYADTDMVVSAGRNAGELLYLLKSSAAPKDYAWKVKLPPGVARVESRNDGLWFLDASGSLVVHVPEPYAIDAVGTKRTALLEYDPLREEMHVALNDRGLVYPVLLDPTFETEVWVELQSPPTSNRSAMVYDEARQRMVLFGGDLSPNETWLWDGSSWRKRVSSRGDALVPPDAVAAWDPVRKVIVAVGGAETALWDGTGWQAVTSGPLPPYRYGHSLTWDAASGQMVLFGGEVTYENSLDDTWAFNGSVWRQVLATTSPPARARHHSVFDPINKRVVVHGGTSTNLNAINDTWWFTGTTWVQAPSGAAPSKRGAFATAWDAAAGRWILHGGYDDQSGKSLNDTWAFDGQRWSQLPPTAGLPARNLYTLTWRPDRNRLVLFGGESAGKALNDSWELNGNTWTVSVMNTTAALRTAPLVGWDIGRNSLVLFGGTIGNVLSPSTFARLSDTWIGGAKEWRQVAGGVTPLARSAHTMVRDDARGNFVMFGGNGLSTGRFGDTWIFDGSRWALNNSTAKPTARTGHKMSWDPVRKVMVVMGGQTPPTNLNSDYVTDSWTFNGSTWVKQNVGSIPPGRGAHVLAWDASTQKTLLFGGSNDDQTFGDTWTFDGLVWTKATTPVAMSARSSATIAWSPKQNSLILVGGDDGISTLDDTWRWSAGAWTNLGRNPIVARTSAQMLWDARREKLVLFGGEDSLQYAAGTLEFDGTSWSKVTTLSSPPLRSAHAFVWDKGRNTAVLFGGADAGGRELSDAWAYDGTNWRTLADRSATAPAPRRNATLVADEPNKRFILFGGSGGIRDFGDTWYLYLRGGSCASGAECGSGYCTEGVCCESQACGTCETCAGISPGKCTPVTSTEDPDSCPASAGKSCDSAGRCGVGLGADCTEISGCAIGVCSGGKCAKTSSCKNERTLVDVVGKDVDCGDYVCLGTACRTTCDSVKDCNAPAVCGQGGTCIRLDAAAPPTDSGCLAVAPTQASPDRLVYGASAVMLIATLRRRKRQR